MRHSHRCVEHDQEPRRERAVQVVLHVVVEPVVLVGADAEGLVVAQRDDVDEAPHRRSCGAGRAWRFLVWGSKPGLPSVTDSASRLFGMQRLGSIFVSRKPTDRHSLCTRRGQHGTQPASRDCMRCMCETRSPAVRCTRADLVRKIRVRERTSTAGGWSRSACRGWQGRTAQSTPGTRAGCRPAWQRTHSHEPCTRQASTGMD